MLSWHIYLYLLKSKIVMIWTIIRITQRTAPAPTIQTMMYEKAAIHRVEKMKEIMKQFSQRDLEQLGMVK